MPIARKITLILATTLVASAGIVVVVLPLVNPRLKTTADPALARDISGLLLASGLTVGLVVAVVAGLWSRRLVRRISRIAATARAVRDGDVDRVVVDEERDEIADLARVFNDMTRSLAQSLHAKDEFVASVSHEVRTPLTAVLGLSSELAEHAGAMSGDEVAELCAIISAQTTEVAHIVEDLLTVARVDRGVLMLRSEVLDMSEEIAAAVATLPDDTGKTIDVAIVPCRVVADPTRVRQVLRNLLTNAARYGGATVEVRVSPTIDGDVGIRVRDDGDGVDAEHATAIFAPYFSAHVQEGLTESVGLGLSVSRKLARAMGGDLRYRRLDGWTVFELRLPAARLGNEEPVGAR